MFREGQGRLTTARSASATEILQRRLTQGFYIVHTLAPKRDQPICDHFALIYVEIAKASQLLDRQIERLPEHDGSLVVEFIEIVQETPLQSERSDAVAASTDFRWAIAF